MILTHIDPSPAQRQHVRHVGLHRTRHLLSAPPLSTTTTTEDEMKSATFHNDHDTMPSSFKALTKQDLDRIGAERREANRKRWITGALIGALAFLGCLAGTGYAVSQFSNNAAPVAKTAPIHRVAQSHSPGPAVKPKATPNAPAPRASAPATQPPAPASVPAVQAPAPVQPAFTSCGAGLAVGPNTSCAFAINVQQAYLDNIGVGSGYVSAYSPVTGQLYQIYCQDNGGTVVATGGDNASVTFYNAAG
jgi:hypothetical protein